MKMSVKMDDYGGKIFSAFQHIHIIMEKDQEYNRKPAGQVRNTIALHPFLPVSRNNGIILKYNISKALSGKPL